MLSEVRSAPGPACPAPFNLAAHVLAQAGAQPDRVALRILHDGAAESWTCGQIESSALAFAAALRQIVAESADALHDAPHSTAICRPDEVAAARKPVLRWRAEG